MTAPTLRAGLHALPGIAALVLAACDATSPSDLSYSTVISGAAYGCGFHDDGILDCWGTNLDGQLGVGSGADDRLAPGRVAGGHHFVTADAGVGHTCAVAFGGEAWCWGSHLWGQLGSGRQPEGEFPVERSPVRVAGDLRFSSVGVGVSHSCGLTNEGDAWCWGAGPQGQRGDGATGFERVVSPVRAIGGHHFTALAVGGDHACALTEAGAAFCWGRNYAGQLGDGTTIDRAEPVAVAGGVAFQTLDAGLNTTCAVTREGAAWCWGRGDAGQRGDGELGDRPAPAAVGGGLRVDAIRVGGAHTCAVTVEREAWCWGDGGDGLLGDGGTAQQPLPVRVLGGLEWETVSPGTSHTCGTTRQGALYCWGANFSGQLGDGSRTPSLVPRRITGGEAS